MNSNTHKFLNKSIYPYTISSFGNFAIHTLMKETTAGSLHDRKRFDQCCNIFTHSITLTTD